MVMSATAEEDRAARQQAIDLDLSCIVQAPAGSGKTELLTLRYLRLLSVSEFPENVLAITFTRKAAAEMLDRIVRTLREARDQGEAGVLEEFERLRRETALAVLRRDREQGWRLLENPARLRVQTIDSFCFYLATQLPLLSSVGGNPRVSEDVTPCLLEAIDATLAQLESDDPIGEDVAALLRHLDNDRGKVERLLTDLLHNRDQWMPSVLEIGQGAEDARNYLQRNLVELLQESLLEAREGLQPFASELLPLFNFAASNLAAAGSLNIQDFKSLDELPPPEFPALPYWVALVDMLLTKSDTWRQTITKNEGFPAGDSGDKEFRARCKEMKQALAALRQRFMDNDDLLESLIYLRLLPNPAYDADMWNFLAALTRVLTRLNGELLVAFQKYRLVDYIQTGAAARAALGSEEQPTDLALALDYRIQHVLVDEFQDTSQLQLEILQQLTAGWQEGDGRSLFLVGDAMQSVYGFRNANVGIYLDVQERGLGSIRLTPLTLRNNFRSQAGLVAWVNEVFSNAFPRIPNSSRGAVPYSESVAFHGPIDGMGITTELLLHERGDQAQARRWEARRVVDRIEALQELEADASIAVLVRSRGHLADIVPELRRRQLQWHATDIDRLEALPVIEDLLSLTRALLNPADRLAWLALLRAPWCGLTLADLHALCRHAGTGSIFGNLQEPAAIDGLSADGRARLQAPLEVLRVAMALRGRRPLRSLVESTWTLLQGPVCVTSAQERASAQQFLSLLEQRETAGGLSKMDDFAAAVASSFIPSSGGDEAARGIHLMTMHKAKGLEFDHVILPGLGNKPRSNERSLLRWHQRLNRRGEEKLFIAARTASGSEDDRLYQLLRHEQQHKSVLENTRLLYIAVTRARRSAYLLSPLALDSKGQAATPPRDSLLARIWRELRRRPGLYHELAMTGGSDGDNALAAQASTGGAGSRFRAALALHPDERKLLQELGSASAAETAPEGVDKLAATAGTLVHEFLEHYVRTADQKRCLARLDTLRAHWQARLECCTNDRASIDDMLEFIARSIRQTVTDSDLAWLFDPALAHSAGELALSAVVHGQLRHYRVDRTFVDAGGERWIVDYKTSAPAAGQSQEVFMREQLQLYAGQLQRYAELLGEVDRRPARTALLFTAIPALAEY